MKCFTQTLFALSIMLLVGCSKPDPNPELMDPIYSDLQKQHEELKKAHEEAKVKITGLIAELEKAEPNSIEKKDIEKDLMKSRKLASDSGQMSEYFRIRAERRKVMDKISYQKAFAEKKPWPDPSEYSDYLTNKRVHEINMNWNARVPKLQDRLLINKKAAEPAKGGGGH